MKPTAAQATDESLEQKVRRLEAENARLREDAAILDWLDKQDCWVGIDSAWGEVRPALVGGGCYSQSVRIVVRQALKELAK